MRIALVYPPPWKIPLAGEPLDPADGPPHDVQPGDLDWDFFQTPYGLFSLGAQALRAGHQVKVINLSGFAWKHVERLVDTLEADVWGLSCWTSNRRGVALVARAIKRRHPRARVVIGGPHATPLAREMLAHHADIDAVCLGESDVTFLELIERWQTDRSLTNTPGLVYRTAHGIEEGPDRASIRDLDTLASPHDHFDTHILMTSRGCAWQCTFCGAETTWGRGFRANSTPYVLDALEAALPRLPVRMIMVKDDTFTTQRKRVLELCRGIRERKLRFVWSCDTRVDVLSEELLYEMRMAGCQRLSLGVESGSPTVLRNIDKKITPDEILRSTELIKKYGIATRFYMMLGNRGETRRTLEETLDFLRAAQPHQYVFSCLSIFPGTRDFYDAEKAGWLDREEYFSSMWQEHKIPFDCSAEDNRYFIEWFENNKGLKHMYHESVDDARAILSRLGDLSTAQLDLGAVLYDAGQFDEAEVWIRRALDGGHPLPGVAHNYLACIASARGRRADMIDELTRGIELDPQHPTLLSNFETVDKWLERRGPERGEPLALRASRDFELLEYALQPTLPGPLPRDIGEWRPASAPQAIAPLRPSEPDRLRQQRLRVIAG